MTESFEKGQERASVCFLVRGEAENHDYLLRLMDYMPDDGNSLTWAYSANRDNRPADNPFSMYRPEVLSEMLNDGDDFICVRWQPNAEKPNRPTVINPYRYPNESDPDIFEVIKCPESSTIEQLQKNLASGWNYSGNPTKRILIVYAEDNRFYNALLMDKNDFEYFNNHIQLKMTDKYRAPSYVLRKEDIRLIPASHTGKSSRFIYTKSNLPLHGGSSVQIRYSNQNDELLEEQRRVIRSQEQQLREQEKTARNLEETVKRLEERNRTLADTYDRLHNIEKEMQGRKDEAELQLKTVQKKLEDASNDIERMEQQKKSILAEIEHLKETTTAEIQQQRETALSRLDDDVALRAGLHSVAESTRATVESMLETHLHHSLEATLATVKTLVEAQEQRTEILTQSNMELMRSTVESTISEYTKKAADKDTAAAPIVHVTTTHDLNTILYPSHPIKQNKADKFTRTMADNLRAYGIRDAKNLSSPPNNLAKAYGRILSTVKLLAVDSTFASAIANSLSYAIYGAPACHATIPADWNDTSNLDELLSYKSNNILVLDNVFNTVNESLLFALPHLHHDCTTILPIGAYGNLRLIATEVWDHVFSTYPLRDTCACR